VKLGIPQLPKFTPRSLPPPKTPRMPQDVIPSAGLIQLRREVVGRVLGDRRVSAGLRRKHRLLENRKRTESRNKVLRVVLGDHTMSQVALKAKLPRSAVWRTMMGRNQPTFLVYLRICWAIQALNRTPREVIDRYLLRVMRHPMP
jgi:DNA-binding phage protein